MAEHQGRKSFACARIPNYQQGWSGKMALSQKFHNERAVYIGRKWGLDVTGYNALDWEDADGVPVRIREVFARFKAFIDVNLTGEQPKFLGDKIIID